MLSKGFWGFGRGGREKLLENQHTGIEKEKKGAKKSER